MDGVIRVRSGALPEEGTITWHLCEMWRAGGEALLGEIRDVAGDESGNAYLLDRQLSVVHVFSPDGQLIRSLSREGEGPGEVRRPGAMLSMPDGSWGLLQGFPARIVKIRRDGTQAGTLRLGDHTEPAGGLSSLRDGACRGGTLALAGWEGTQRGSVFERTYFLAIFADDGAEEHRLLSQSVRSDFSKPRYIEKDEYFSGRDWWTLGPRGCVFAAPERDRYVLHVNGPDGTLLRIVEREFTPCRRTSSEIARLAADRNAIVDGRLMEFETEIEDHEPCVVRIHVTDDGDLWVLGNCGHRNQPPGIMETHDVFDPQGHFVRQVAIACPGDARRDRLFFLHDGRIIMVTGFSGNAGEDDRSDEGLEHIEIVCYERQE